MSPQLPLWGSSNSDLKENDIEHTIFKILRYRDRILSIINNISATAISLKKTIT